MTSHSRPNLSREAIREFLIETQEGLEQVEVDLVELERNPHAVGASSTGVGRMFRMLHSIKGTCGFLGYPKLEELAHVGESLLGRIREGILPIDATVITALLSIVDATREVLDHIETENNEGNQDYSNLTQHLSQILRSDETPRPVSQDKSSASSDPGTHDASQAHDAAGQPRDGVRDSPPGGEKMPADDANTLDSVARTGGQFSPQLAHAAADQSDSIAGSLHGNSPDASNKERSSLQLESSQAGQASRSRGEERQSDSRAADSTLRIDVALLDKMMMLAGELVLTRNQILQDTTLESEGRLHGV